MDQEIEPLDLTRLISERVATIRKKRGMTQEALAVAMQEVGIDWERVVVAKLESGRRSFVKVDELLALCLVLQITPVDLLVPADLEDHQLCQVAPKVTAEAGFTREWIKGEGLLPALRESASRGDPFWSPVGMLHALDWMPPDRADRVARRYFHDLDSMPADRANRVTERYTDFEDEEGQQ
jgi:transcriptional regulator with XRE-family HTH domain